MEFDLITPPSWSATWCYFYFFSTVLGAAVVVAIIVMNAKKIGMVGVIVAALGLAINFLHGMTYFWMCRGALSQYSA
jgi:hypothetical protein